MRRVMRFVLFAMAVCAFAPCARADDLDIMRGTLPVAPATFTRWSGFYVGGQFGYSNAIADFSHSTQGPIAYALRETTLQDEFSPSQWQVLGKANTNGMTYGGFAGYNSQWQDLMLGFEADYDWASLHLVAASSGIGPLITPADSQGYTHTVQISGAGSMTNLSFGSLRGRAGVVLGGVMPYGFAGLAIGGANTAVSAKVQDNQCTTTTPSSCTLFTFNAGGGNSSALIYGFVAGAGVDFGLTPNLFARAEFEYAQFAPISGIIPTIVTGRLGAAYKF